MFKLKLADIIFLLHKLGTFPLLKKTCLYHCDKNYQENYDEA